MKARITFDIDTDLLPGVDSFDDCATFVMDALIVKARNAHIKTFQIARKANDRPFNDAELAIRPETLGMALTQMAESTLAVDGLD